MFHTRFLLLTLLLSLLLTGSTITGYGQTTTTPFSVVDTGQGGCYDESGTAITCPQPGELLSGQDAQYQTTQPHYTDNGDGTITDHATGLMWQKTPNLVNKSSWAEAVAGAETFDLAGYDDWRLPTIKELYSLIDFNGSGMQMTPYIDTDYFDFRFGDTSLGERVIDAQYWSSTEYVGTTFGGAATVFGVNFADGRIKGYPRESNNGERDKRFVRYVRGNTTYGINDFADNGDGTITDYATGLMWQQSDDGVTRNWSQALAYCEALDSAGYDDWRLPDAKELQSIVDYTRAPDATNPTYQGAAIDPIFGISETESWFWTSTSHLDNHGKSAVYIAFGQAYGVFTNPATGETTLVNVHGAGAQRSDPKSGDPNAWANGHGPQNDEIRIYNHARCVRGGNVEPVSGTDVETTTPLNQQHPNQPPNQERPNQQPSNQQPGRTPPPAAISACSGASVGATCTMQTPRGTIQGTCQQVQQQLACVPQGGPPANAP